MRVIKTYFLILFSLMFVCANADLKKADMLFRNKQFIEASEVYKQTMYMQDDRQIINSCIKGLGHSFFEMGMYEKADFYYKKYLKSEKDYTVMKNLLFIFKQNDEKDNIISLLELFPETEEKYVEKINILKSMDREADLMKNYIKLFSLTGKYIYFLEAYKIDSDILKGFNSNEDIVFITKYYNGKIKRKDIIDNLKNISRIKQMNIADYMDFNKDVNCILIYENLNKEFDVLISRKLIKLYFNYAKINKVKDEVQKCVKKLGHKRFLDDFYYNLSSLAMYDTIIKIIKSIPDYYQDPSIFYKLLDVYRNGMSYSKYFEELLFLNKKGYFPVGRINSVCKNLFYSDTKWANAFCKTDLIQIVSKDVYALALYYSQNTEKLRKLINTLNKYELEILLSNIRDKRNIIDLIQVEKISEYKLYSYMKYYDFEKIQKIFEESDEHLVILESALLLIKDNNIITSDIMKELSRRIQLKKLLFELKKHILLKNTRKDLVFYDDKKNIFNSIRINYFNNIDVLNGFKDYYMKRLIRLICQELFIEENYKDIKLYYEKLNIEKDDLYWSVYAILSNNPENIIINTENWFRLELYRVSVLDKGEEKSKMIKELYLNRGKN